MTSVQSRDCTYLPVHLYIFLPLAVVVCEGISRRSADGLGDTYLNGVIMVKASRHLRRVVDEMIDNEINLLSIQRRGSGIPRGLPRRYVPSDNGLDDPCQCGKVLCSFAKLSCDQTINVFFGGVLHNFPTHCPDGCQ